MRNKYEVFNPLDKRKVNHLMAFKLAYDIQFICKCVDQGNQSPINLDQQATKKFFNNIHINNEKTYTGWRLDKELNMYE